VPVPTFPITCGHCSHHVGAEIVFIQGVRPPDLTAPGFRADQYQRQTLWLRCPACGEGSVRTATGPSGGPGVVIPGALPSSTVSNLPSDVAAAWTEARRSHATGAYTAAEIMCRKILMHLAVDMSGSAPGKSFVQYIDDLEAGNYIMAGLKPVVDQIRSRGNKANHELPASTQQESISTMTITQHLLSGIYELPTLAGSPASAGAPPATTQLALRKYAIHSLRTMQDDGPDLVTVDSLGRGGAAMADQSGDVLDGDASIGHERDEAVA
jgi:Domain of unknown function (DUF4145)